MTDRYEQIKARGKSQPETFRQAQTWELVKNTYRADGLCTTCAAQAAWGHQNGFTTIEPPCPACVPVIAGFPFPVGESSPWRRHQEGRKHPAQRSGSRPGHSRVLQLPPRPETTQPVKESA